MRRGSLSEEKTDEHRLNAFAADLDNLSPRKDSVPKIETHFTLPETIALSLIRKLAWLAPNYEIEGAYMARLQKMKSSHELLKDLISCLEKQIWQVQEMAKEDAARLFKKHFDMFNLFGLLNKFGITGSFTPPAPTASGANTQAIVTSAPRPGNIRE